MKRQLLLIVAIVFFILLLAALLPPLYLPKERSGYSYMPISQGIINLIEQGNSTYKIDYGIFPPSLSLIFPDYLKRHGELFNNHYYVIKENNTVSPISESWTFFIIQPDNHIKVYTINYSNNGTFTVTEERE